jgi:hypothetical protein
MTSCFVFALRFRLCRLLSLTGVFLVSAQVDCREDGTMVRQSFLVIDEVVN